MKPVINKDACIGCGTCEGICPEVFKLTDGISEVIELEDYKIYSEKIKQAIDSCPVQCITQEE